MRISAQELVSRSTLVAAASLLVALPLSVSAQATLTPAQQAAAARAKATASAKAQADAKAKADAVAAANANAKLRADMAAKGKADEAARVAAHNPNNPSEAARMAAHNGNNANTTTPMANPHNPWGARPAAVAATAVPATAVAQPTAVPGTTGTPANHTFWQGLMNNGNTAGATSAAAPGGGYAATPAPAYSPTSATRAAGNNTFAAGVGRFQYSNQTAVLYGCLRAQTRLFCDYDQFASSPTQANANWGATLVVPGGRTYSQKTATYVDADGSSFPHAELNPTTGVRMMVEYDDVPESYTTVSMVLGSNRVDNVPVSNMVVQDNGNLAPRTGGNYPAAGTASGAGPSTGGGVVQNLNQAQTNATGAAQNASDKVNNARQRATDAKGTATSIWNSLKGTGTAK